MKIVMKWKNNEDMKLMQSRERVITIQRNRLERWDAFEDCHNLEDFFERWMSINHPRKQAKQGSGESSRSTRALCREHNKMHVKKTPY
jgi:hypothetical protein